MRVYTKRLVGPVVNLLPAGTWATVGTCPVGHVWVLRNILVENGAADASHWWLAVNGTAVANRMWNQAIPSLTSQQLETRIALTAGETLRYRCTTTALAGTVLTVTGYDFDAS